MMPLIDSKKIENNRVCYKLSKYFSQKYINEELSISYPDEIDVRNLPPTIVDVPLITSVIAIIWISGQRYTIDEMDEELYYSLIKVKEFFKRYFCNTLWKGELRPRRLVKNRPPQREDRPAMLFTAGLDSTTTLLRHFDENPVLISFNQPNEIAIDFAKKNHFDFYMIEVNHERFLKRSYLNTLTSEIPEWLWDTSLALSWIGISTPFLYSKGISSLYIASDNHWGAHIFPDGNVMQRAACPIIDENTSPMGLKVKHDPFDMTRVDKVNYIATFCQKRNMPKPKLTVCWQLRKKGQSSPNCNACEKCYRTMLDILVTGQDPRDYGFELSPDELISRFCAFIPKYKMQTRTLYPFYRDIQEYISRHISELPVEYRFFYEWLISIDFWKMVEELPRPSRALPFKWEDYRDLYPEMPSQLS